MFADFFGSLRTGSSPSMTLQRARRAVFLTEGDPTVPRAIRVVQISDLHVGKTGYAAEIQENLEGVLREVNALARLSWAWGSR